MLSIINRLFDEPTFSKFKYSFFLNNESDKVKYQKKIENAKKEYSNIHTDSESIVFLFDDTLFGSAKNGFFLTPTTIYCDAFADKDGIELKDIDSLSVNTPIERKIFLKNSNQLDMGHIYFTTKDDKDIQKILLPLLSKYILISRLVAAAGEDHNESEILDKAFEMASDPKNLESFNKTEHEFLKIFSKEQEPIHQIKNAKDLYKEKIISGEIDPSEVSFEDFKEQLRPDPKALYREKVASGEIDPTEISFEEFKESLKPDLKALYKEKIASGEIDPTEVSFDEFKSEFEDMKESRDDYDEDEDEDNVYDTTELFARGLTGGEVVIGKFDDEQAESIQKIYEKTKDADEFFGKFIEIIGADSDDISDIITAVPDHICHENAPWMEDDEPIDFGDIECEYDSVSDDCDSEDGYPDTASAGIVLFSEMHLEDGIYSLVFWGGKSSYHINIKDKDLDEITNNGMSYLAHSIVLPFSLGTRDDGRDSILSPDEWGTIINLPKTFWQKNSYNDVANEYEIDENGDELEILDDYIRRVVIIKVEHRKATKLFVKDLANDEVFYKRQ